MRVFLIAVTAMIAVAVGAYYGLNLIQKPADVAFAVSGARLDAPGQPGG